MIRPATPADAAALAAIYSHHILLGTGTFEEEPVDAAEMARRLDAIVSRGWPWLVAEEDGEVAGYGYLSQYRDRSGYRYTGETSLYVAAAAAGRGLGTRLLEALIEAGGAYGFRRLVAVIGDGANLPSIRLHERFGFAHAGRLEGIGRKFGRDLDVLFLQRTIGGAGE